MIYLTWALQGGTLSLECEFWGEYKYCSGVKVTLLKSVKKCYNMYLYCWNKQYNEMHLETPLFMIDIYLCEIIKNHEDSLLFDIYCKFMIFELGSKPSPFLLVRILFAIL